MTLVPTQIIGPRAVWRHVGPLQAASIYSAIDSRINWPTGVTTPLTKGILAKLLPSATSAIIDLTAGPWVLCCSQGDGNLYAIQEKNAGLLDTQLNALFSGKDTTVLSRYEIRGPSQWSGGIVPPGIPPPGTLTGDMLYWDNTAHAWVILHIS